MKKLKLFALLTAVAVLSNVLVLQTALAAEDSETVTGTITGGSLSITAPGGNTALEGKSVSTSTQATTGTVTTITVDDDRATGVGWTVSSTSTRLGLAGTSAQERVVTTGSGAITTSYFATTGVYNGMNPQTAWTSTGGVPSGEFTILVDTVASYKPATVTVTAPDTSASNPTVTADAITFNGMTVTFSGDADHRWLANDDVRIRVDAHGYDQLTVTPGTIGSVSNETTVNITAQSAAAYDGSSATSNSRNDVIASAGYGIGSFTYNHALSQVLHANSMAGNYQATLTLTVA